MRSIGLACLAVVTVVLGSSTLMSQQSTSIRLTADEKMILDLTNAARKEKDLPPLLVNEKLLKAARDHAGNMAKQKKISHELDGMTAFDRIKAVGYRARAAGENVASGGRPVSIPEIFDGWMMSDGHRANILSADYTEIGIGIGSVDDQRYYAQVFGRR